MTTSKRKARKEALSKGFRSNFEYDIAKFLSTLKIPFEYENRKISYIVPETKKTYTPDWEINGEKGILYESKGRFTSVDRKKMLQIKECNPNLTIRMIFQNSLVKISKTSKTSYADWCDKHGIEWCDFRDKRKLERWFK